MEKQRGEKEQKWLDLNNVCQTARAGYISWSCACDDDKLPADAPEGMVAACRNDPWGMCKSSGYRAKTCRLSKEFLHEQMEYFVPIRTDVAVELAERIHAAGFSLETVALAKRLTGHTWYLHKASAELSKRSPDVWKKTTAQMSPIIQFLAPGLVGKVEAGSAHLEEDVVDDILKELPGIDVSKAEIVARIKEVEAASQESLDLDDDLEDPNSKVNLLVESEGTSLIERGSSLSSEGGVPREIAKALATWICASVVFGLVVASVVLTLAVTSPVLAPLVR